MANLFLRPLTRCVLAVAIGLSGSAATDVAFSAPDQENVPAAVLSQATPSIVDIAVGDDNFETLVAALKAAGLVETLAGTGPFTVFAPTDAAFANLPDGVVVFLVKPENKDLLTEILKYHVVAGEVTSGELSTGEVETLNGEVAVTVDGDSVEVGEASVIKADVDASNGVIHVIDEVLVPPATATKLTTRLRAAQN
ncbi:MAG: fasciclin domain-containing protein [Cyanobacteria bacterium P01_H01_bin.15]